MTAPRISSTTRSSCTTPTRLLRHGCRPRHRSPYSPYHRRSHRGAYSRNYRTCGTAIVLEPYFDSYAAAIALAGTHRIAVPLAPNNNSWNLDITALRDAITPQTRMIIVNSPHNPTEAVFSKEELPSCAP
ncbi:aminotransferase class I/II-fold pyridoxal phosphate-dependent enzyme [Corynebacterium diphtheriae]|uniref:aminotransferase class I/II-fold pyridoxal phosphate-dependent enzyme n=1 Tax=Corynebacterium diphtheriae TaxID=1717 RepID=UPI001EF0D0E5|nr:aminotransferase class I/II-fold pyridoxal phosphate-dependent enzyme [Corynebacterium diphtheriae]